MDEVELIPENGNSAQVLVNTFFEIDEWASSADIVKVVISNEDTAIVDVLYVEQVAVLKVVGHRCVPDYELISSCDYVHEIAEWLLLSILIKLLDLSKIVGWDVDPSWTRPIWKVDNQANASVFLASRHWLVT